MEQTPIILIFTAAIAAKRIQPLLAQFGYGSQMATDKTGLMEQLAGQKVDLVLLDVAYGEKKKCLDAARQSCQLRNIPMIYLLPTRGEWLETNRLQFDLDGYLLKPIRPRDLQISIKNALAKRREKTNSERQLAELALVHDISQAAASIHEVSELLQYITRRICSVLGPYAAYIALDDPAENILLIPKWDAETNQINYLRLPRDTGLTARVLHTREAILINRDMLDEVTRLGGLAHLQDHYSFPKSWIGVPMIAQGEIVGVVCMQDFEKEDAFSQEQIDLLATIAASLGIALRNARLFHTVQRELQRSHERERELSETKQKLETLLERLPVGVSILNEKDEIILSNLALSSILGLTPAQLASGAYRHRTYLRSDGSLMRPDEAASRRAILSQRPIYHQEIGVQKEDGQITWTEVSAMPIAIHDWRVILVTADITPRKRAEATLIRSEFNLREAQRIAHMGRWEMDLTTGRMEWSEGMYTLLELLPHQITSTQEAFTEYTHPDDRANLEHAYLQSLENHTHVQLAYRFQLPDGRIKWVNEICYHDYDANDQAVRAVGIVYDVTELHHIQHQLRLQSAALESAANGVMITNRKGLIEWVNPAFTAITGYTLADTHGQTPRMLKSGKQPPEFYAELWATITAGHSWHGEMIDRHKDGHLVAIEQFIAPVRDASNHITHFVVIMIDVSERARVQQQLRLQSAALEAADNAIVITDPQGYIEWANPAFTTLTGYLRDEVAGQHTRLLKSSAHPKEFYDELWRTVRAGMVWQGNLINRHKSGRLYHEEMTITPLRAPNGDITHFIAIKQDISPRIQAETELRQYAEEQAALYAVASVATSQLDPEELLKITLDVILDIPHLAAACGWVLLLDESTGDLSVGAARNLSAEFLQAESDNSAGLCPICVKAIQNRSGFIETHRMSDCPRVPPELLEREGLQTHIGIPLKVGERVLGILNLGWRAPAQYSPNHQTMLYSIGKHVSLALHHAKLYQDALQINHLKLIHQIGSEMNASIELDEVFRRMLGLTCRALNGSEGSILLCEAESGDLVLAYALSTSIQSLRGSRIKAGSGLAGWVAETRQAALVNDAQHDPRWSAQFDHESGFQTHSILCAPLIDAGEVIGVIEVVNNQSGGFTGEDVYLLEAISPLAAVAIKNARLFTDTRRRAEELDTLNHIGHAMTRSLNSQEIVSTALARIQQQFDASYASLVKRDPVSGDIVTEYAIFGGEIVPNASTIRLRPEESCATQALNEHRAILKYDLLTDHETSETIRSMASLQTRALMIVPLMMVDQVLGALEVVSEQAGRYDANDLRVLQSIASAMVIALENARLYEDSRQLLAERERAQAHLIQSEKAAALGRLAATVAHEINNPLQAIQGCLGLFDEEMEGQGRPEKMKHYLNTVEGEIDRIAAIVRRMRDFYRPGRAGMQPTDLPAVLQGVLELSAKQFQHSEVMVETHWENRLPRVQANADHLKQVFLNMVINAIDAMPEGGRLQVAIHPATLPREAEPPIPALRVTFTDSGYGIPPDVLARLFEPFYTTKPNGTGLGLYVSAGIIQAHNGKIEIESQPDVGTTFHIFIPIAERQEP